MKNQSILEVESSTDTVQINLDSYAKLEQAELITRLTINSNLNKKETMIAMCCISDLLHQTMIELL